MDDSNETIDLSQRSELNNRLSRMRDAKGINVCRIVNQVSETIGISNFIPALSRVNALEDLIDWFEE